MKTFKKSLILLATLCLSIPVHSQTAKINRLADMENGGNVPKISWYQGASIQFNVDFWQDNSPLTIASDSVPVWGVWSNGVSGVAYINATGTVVSTSGSVRFTLPNEDANLVEGDDYLSIVTVYSDSAKTQAVAGAYSELEVKYSVLGDSITNVVGTPLRVGSIVGGTGISVASTGTTYTISATGSGTGDVVGPASAVDGNVATFDTTTGKLINDGGVALADLLTDETDPVWAAVSNLYPRIAEDEDISGQWTFSDDFTYSDGGASVEMSQILGSPTVVISNSGGQSLTLSHSTLSRTSGGDLTITATLIPSAFNGPHDIGAVGTPWGDIYGTFIGSGAGLTTLSGTSITSGTVADARVASTIARDSELHDAVALAGSLDYITLTDQVLTRNAIDLSTDTTGTLDEGNVDDEIARDDENYRDITTTNNWSGSYTNAMDGNPVVFWNQTGEVTNIVLTTSHDMVWQIANIYGNGSNVTWTATNTAGTVFYSDDSGSWTAPTITSGAWNRVVFDYNADRDKCFVKKVGQEP
ncbi:hypothetical protein N9204_00370 [bacterium]|nr:hypothetical protein [bacterium]